MLITLYKNSSDPKKVLKNITDGVTFNVTLKGTCNIENPVFVLTRINNSLFVGYNYIYCKEFNRYYYARISIDAGGLMTISCTIDPLMSYASAIRSLTCLVERQESYYNPYLVDDGITMTQGSVVNAIKVGQVGDSTSKIYVTCIGAVDTV